MNIVLPQLIPECEQKAQQFCSSCRDFERGKDFRETILKIRGLDKNTKVNFECPKGKPWTNTKTQEQNMKVITISKTQVQEKARTIGVGGSEFINTITQYSIGGTGKHYIFPTDKFIILKEKFGLKEENNETFTEQTTSSPKIITKTKTKKKGCSTCGRRK